MKSIKNLFLPAVLLLSSFTPVAQQCKVSDNYSVTIHGTSNLHDWDETVQKISGQCEINWNGDRSFDINAIHLEMNVRSIKSDSKVMDNNTYKALKADTYPEIIFNLHLPVKSIQAAQTANTISAQGDLTIAGVTKPIDMQVKVSTPEKGVVQVEGSQTIKMTDYGVTPPVALLGMLKTGNDITIHFKTAFATNATESNSSTKL